MTFADTDIAEFQALYLKNFGKEIDKNVAIEKGLRLLRLIEAVSRSIARDVEQGSLINTDNN